jgi:transposase
MLLCTGPEVTPRRRASIVTLAFIGLPFRKIEQITGVRKSTANVIFRHAVTNATDKRIEAISSALAASVKGGEPEEWLCNAEERANDAKRWEQEWQERKERKGNTERADTYDFLASIEDGIQMLNLQPPMESATPPPHNTAAPPSPSRSTAAPPLPSRSTAAPPPPSRSTAAYPEPERVLVTGAELTLQELVAADVLDPKKRLGRPPALTEAEKDQLIATVKQDFKTRRMRLVDIRRESGLAHVSDSTVLKPLHERKIKAYREEFKFILSSENKQIRLVYCQERQHWEVDKEWANCGFTDEMAIEVGGTFGVCLV